jgi:AbrB family looped-hinge helix DNA binding protein
LTEQGLTHHYSLMNTSRVTPQLRATIPAGVRKALGLNVGDWISWRVDDDGEVEVRRVADSSVDPRTMTRSTDS